MSVVPRTPDRLHIVHSHLTLSNLSSFLLVPLFGYPIPPIHPVCERILDPPVLSFSLYNCITTTPIFTSVFPLVLVLSVIINIKTSQSSCGWHRMIFRTPPPGHHPCLKMRDIHVTLVTCFGRGHSRDIFLMFCRQMIHLLTKSWPSLLLMRRVWLNRWGLELT